MFKRFLRAVGRAIPALVCDLAGLGGAGLIAYGAWLIYVPAGHLVAGGLLLAAAWLGARRLS